MAKKEKNKLEGLARFNRVSKPTNVLFSIVFILGALLAVLPFVLVVIISFTDKGSIVRNGYTFMPDTWSLRAYQSIWDLRASVFRSFGVSVLITVAGTALGLFLNAVMGYVLSRRSFKLRGLYTWLVFIPMVFNGGLVANYMLITKVLHIDNNILVLIVPLAVASFYVIILRTFFTTTVPDSLIESGKIDGASQLRIFFQIVLRISLPALATVGLFLSFAYWNDWFSALMYIEKEALYPLQYVLVRIDKNIEFVTRNAQLMGMAANEYQRNMPTDGVRMAIVVVAVLPIACAYPFFQRYFISGLTIGAVKG